MRWLQLLAHTRGHHSRPASLSGTMSPPSPGSSAYPLPLGNGSHLNMNNNGRVRSRSSATSYFALLSSTEDKHHQHDRPVSRKQHYHHRSSGSGSGSSSGSRSGSGTPTGRHMDDCSSWVPGWLGAYGPHPPPTHHAIDGQYHCSGQSYFPLTEPPTHSLSESSCHGPHVMAPNSSLGTSTLTTTTTPPSTISSTATPFSSPLAPLTDAEIDAMILQFPDLTDGFPPGYPDSMDEMGPFDPAEADAGLASWLNEQHAFALNLSEEPSVGQSKRGLTAEGYSGDMSADGTSTSTGMGIGWETGIKKLKVFHEEFNQGRT